MINVQLTKARVAKIHKGLYTNPNTNLPTMTFSVAVPRNYPSTVTAADGSQRKEYKSDFVYCEVTGKLAETMSKLYDLKKEDGSLYSRKLELFGTFESYQNTRQVSAEVEFDDGNVCEIEGIPVSTTEWKFIVDKFEADDANPENAGNATQAGKPKAKMKTTATTQAVTQQTTANIPNINDIPDVGDVDPAVIAGAGNLFSAMNSPQA